jgi:hypothetical protein
LISFIPEPLFKVAFDITFGFIVCCISHSWIISCDKPDGIYPFTKKVKRNKQLTIFRIGVDIPSGPLHLSNCGFHPAYRNKGWTSQRSEVAIMLLKDYMDLDRVFLVLKPADKSTLLKMLAEKAAAGRKNRDRPGLEPGQEPRSLDS